MQVKVLHIKLISGLFLILYAGASLADYDVANLKKLFTDKSQRTRIDAARSGNYSGSGLQQTNKIKVSGYVTRSDGKNVAWVNDKNTLDSTGIGDVKVHQSSIGKNKKVTLTMDKKTIRLKAGETWSEASDYNSSR